MKSLIAISLTLGAVAAANAASFVVDAYANSSATLNGASTISLAAGQQFTVSVAAGDLWNAGALPRWSNADGLTGNLYATGSDDSGQAANTLIGIDFGTYTQGNLTAAYGTLVGQIDNGDFFVVGSNYSGTAATAGTLKLYYWDSNYEDNSQFITANVQAVPEPMSMIVIAGGVAAMLRRRRK